MANYFRCVLDGEQYTASNLGGVELFGLSNSKLSHEEGQGVLSRFIRKEITAIQNLFDSGNTIAYECPKLSPVWTEEDKTLPLQAVVDSCTGTLNGLALSLRRKRKELCGKIGRLAQEAYPAMFSMVDKLEAYFGDDGNERWAEFTDEDDARFLLDLSPEEFTSLVIQTGDNGRGYCFIEGVSGPFKWHVNRFGWLTCGVKDVHFLQGGAETEIVIYPPSPKYRQETWTFQCNFLKGKPTDCFFVNIQSLFSSVSGLGRLAVAEELLRNHLFRSREDLDGWLLRVQKREEKGDEGGWKGSLCELCHLQCN